VGTRRGGREQAARQQNLAREQIAKGPQDFVSHVGLHPVEGEDDLSLSLEQSVQAGGVGEAQGDQFFVARKQVGYGALADGHLPLFEEAMDLGHAAMFLVAAGSHERHEIQTALGLGQGERPFFPGGKKGRTTRW